MNRKLNRKTELMGRRMLAKKRGGKRWQRIVSVLGCIVVFSITYALILPAITLVSEPLCGIEAHEHSENCYENKLICTLSDTEPHIHTDDCWRVERVQKCLLPETESHAHTEECWGLIDEMICPLAECEPHTHTDDCYALRPGSSLICQLEANEEHTHDDSCYEQESVLVCGLEATEGHTHGEGCFQQKEAYICGLEETAGHKHDETCFAEEKVLCCGMEEGSLHVHSDACYGMVKTCLLPEHTHTDECNEQAFVPDDDLFLSKRPNMTGNWSNDLVALAMSQLGYREGSDGYTMYSSSYDGNGETWNAAFAIWCLNGIGIPEARLDAEVAVFQPNPCDAASWIKLLSAENLLQDGMGAQPGDLLFFSDSEAAAVRVGIISERILDNFQELTGWKLIIGDSNGAVELISCNVNELHLVGYVSLPANPELDEEPAGEDEEKSEEDATVETVDEDKNESGDSYIPTGPIWATVEVAGVDGENIFPMMMLRSFSMTMLAEAPVGPTPLVLGDTSVPGSGNTGAAKIKWREPGEIVWHDFAYGDQIPANSELQIALDYGDVSPDALASHGYKVVYYAEDIMDALEASGEIRMEGEKRGVITATTIEQDGMERTAIMLDFSSSGDWVDSLGTSTLQGTFTYQGRLDLGKLEESGESGISLAGIAIEVPDKDDATSKYASVDLDKTHGGMIHAGDGKYYMEYTLKVTAGKYGAPDVKLIDNFTEDIQYVGKYVGVTEAPQNPSVRTDPAEGPVETISGSATPQVSSVYLTNDTAGQRGEMPAPASGGTRLAWAIGNMAPNESRTLTYRVEVEDNYIGLPHNNDNITNTANLFSKEFERGSVTVPFNADANASVSKTSANGRLGDDGRYYIDYTATITADANNDYPLSDVKYNDIVNQFMGGAYVDEIRVEDNSIRLFKVVGETTTEMNLQDYTRYTDAQGNPATRDNPKMNGTNRFDVFVGDLNPGEVREIRYTMSIDLDAATAKGNGDIGIYNYGYVYSDEVRQNQQIDSSNTSDTLKNIRWMNKQRGTQTSSAETVTFPAGADVFDATGNTAGLERLPIVPGVNSYIIPTNAYHYRVVINQSGEWDVSATQWRDELKPSSDGNRYMQFVEYVRVDVYDTVNNSTNPPVGFNEDGTTAPKKSVWVKIDGNWSFAFTGKQIGLDGDDAYILNYYTVAVLPEGVTSYGTAEVDNSFSMSGDVIGPGPQTFHLNGIQESVRVTAKEPGVNDPIKRAWYYDPDDTTFRDYHTPRPNNGALYWVIKMSGDKIPKNMQFQESTRVNTGNPTHYLRNNESLLGFYIIRFDEGADSKDSADEFFARYENIHDFYDDLNSDSGNIREVPPEIYSQRWNGYTSTTYGNNGEHFDFTVQFLQDYGIGANEALYLLVKTDPVSMPGNGTAMSYANKCNYKTDAMGPVANWPNVSDTQSITGPQGSIDKNASGTYTVTNNNFTKIDPNSAEVKKDVALDRTDFESTSAANMTNNYPDGTYVMWTMSVDKGQKMNGAYELVDTLPEGVELVYVRPSVAYTSFNRPFGYYYYYVGPDITNRDAIKDATRDIGASYKGTTWAWTVTADMPGLEGEGWTRHICASKCTNATDSRNATAAIYYTKDNQIRMYLPYINGNKFDFQVLCRLTPEAEQNLLLGDVILNNQVELYQDDKKVDGDGAEITVSGGGVSKNILMEGLYNKSDPSKLASTRFPYTIDINTERKDMIPESEVLTIPLVDRMTGNMSLDLSTLEIYALPAGVEQVTDYSYLVYYGGMYSNKAADQGKPWYDPAQAGKPVGNCGNTQIVIATRNAVDANNNDVPILDKSGRQMKEIVFENLPDSTKIVIKYSVSVTMDGGRLMFDNNAFWEGFENNSGGGTEEVVMDYLAESEVSETLHGAVHVVKYDNDNINNRLANAEFRLYRAEYVVASQGYALIGDEPKDTVGEHFLAVYQGTDTSATSADPEIRVRYNEDGTSIQELEVITGSGREWMPINTAKSNGFSFHHQFDLLDGKMHICPRETLAIGSTDSNGNLSYGFGSDLDFGRHYIYDEQGNKIDIQSTIQGENRIHFNKVYAVVETGAPEGYVLDETPHFFVIPNSHSSYDGQGLNYFYRDSWPEGVHVCTKSENNEITFMANIGNSHPRLALTKDFAGTLDAYKPGVYNMGIWAEDVDRATPQNMITSVSIHYTADDFGYYTPKDETEEIYGLLPGHEKTVEFPISLPFGTYRLYELNDSGYPIAPVAGVSSGTVNGLTYTVSLSGSSAVEDTPDKIVYDGTHHDVKVTNTTYILEITKRFKGVSGEYMEQGLKGTYRFGIWPASEVDTTTGLPTTPVGLRNVQEISWTLSDVSPSKTVQFSGLAGDTTYYVFELNEANEPIPDHISAMISGSKFMVVYENGNTGTPKPQNNPNIDITNAATVILPSTGGKGTNFFTNSGVALIALACFGYAVYFLRRTRRKEESS